MMLGRRTCLWKFLPSNDIRDAEEYLRRIEGAFEQWNKTQRDFKYVGTGSSRLSTEPIVQVGVTYLSKKESWHFKFVGSRIPHLQATTIITDREERRETQWPNLDLCNELLRAQVCDLSVPYPGNQTLGYTAFLYLRYKVEITPVLKPFYERTLKRVHKSPFFTFLTNAQSEFKARGRELSTIEISRKEIRRFVADCETELMSWWGKNKFDQELFNHVLIAGH